MSDFDRDIDWSKTTFEGSRREQLRRWRALSVRQRLEALDEMSEVAQRLSHRSPIIQSGSADRAPASPTGVREHRARYDAGNERHDIVLRGCMPTPLASYLKALAVLRLVAESSEEDVGDPHAMGFWQDDVFVLRTRLTIERVRTFFLEKYRPTPLIAPWNGGSGFYAGDNLSGIAPLAGSDSQRFDAYRRAIETGQKVVRAMALEESPKLEAKAIFLQALRNHASENLLRWMDAAVILSNDDPRYPPLLGTGGNDGRLDFTNNFMQRIGELFDIASGAPRPGVQAHLDTALFDMPSSALADRAIGQFSPGSAGGPNAAAGFEGNARINPWDFVLMLEGAVLFAASTARRLESADPAILVAPFTVRSRAGIVGNASANDDGDARGEIWMPLWKMPSGIDELRQLFMEGRSSVAGRASRDGLDFARAIAQLGVDRGISSFQRYGFLQRSGKAYLATPLNRVEVCRRPEADLVVELERRNWLSSVQRHARDETAPNAFRTAARQLDTALFALVQQPHAGAFQSVLRCIGQIEAALSISRKSQETVRAPVPPLSLSWALNADDGSAEFRIACALAGLRIRGADQRFALHARCHLSTVTPPNARGDRDWEPASHTVTWGPGSLSANLSALLHRRRLEAAKIDAEGQLLASAAGARCDDIVAFLSQLTDEARISGLLAGLACVDLTDLRPPPEHDTAALMPAFALLKTFFTPERMLRRLDLKWLAWLTPEVTLHLPPGIPVHLKSGDVETAVGIAWRRLRAYGVNLPGANPPDIVLSAAERQRWLAALCIPLTFVATRRLLECLPFSTGAAAMPNATNDA